MLSFVTSFLGLFPSKCQGKQSPITPLQKYPSFALKLGNWSWRILSFTLWWKKKSWWPLKVTKDQLHYCCFASDRCMPWELSTVLCSSGPFLILPVHRFLQPSNKFHGEKKKNLVEAQPLRHWNHFHPLEMRYQYNQTICSFDYSSYC